jgi:hypothetical protein
MTSRTFATLFALTVLTAVALPTSAQANCITSKGASVPRVELNPVLSHQRVPGRSANQVGPGITPHVLPVLHHRLRLALHPPALGVGQETKV